MIIFAKTSMEKHQQEIAVKRIKITISQLLLGFVQLVSQIVTVIVQKASALHKITEHKTIQHNRGVPFHIQLCFDAGYETK